VRIESKPEEERAKLLHHSGGIQLAAAAKRMHLEETRRGELIHNVLARIVFVPEDPLPDLQKAIAEEISQSGAAVLESVETVLSRFLKGDIKGYFKSAEGRSVLNEQDFARSDGQLFRMDRVVVDPETVTVIDYKTGEEQDGYGDQVRNYMQILSDVYAGKTVKGLLAYVDKNVLQVVE